MIPVLEKVGRAAFMFYMFFVLVSFIVAVAYQIGGVAETPDIVRQNSNLPDIKPSATLGGESYDAVLQYIQTTQTVTFLSFQAVMQALSYILNSMVNMGGFLASLAHALFNNTPLHGPAVAVAATFGYAIQGMAWIWIISSIASLIRG
jgi:hypothetical protein